MSTLKNKSTMPKAYLKKWLKALRSGEYKQGKGTLYSAGQNGNDPQFCCLGVLQHCLTGGVEFNAGIGMAQGLPSREWLRDYNINFVTEYNDINNPSLQMGNGIIRYASAVNDSGRHSFSKIADMIEKSFIGT